MNCFLEENPRFPIYILLVAPELRNKIDETREKCRLIGYLDDDDSEEMECYLILLEDQGATSVSNDVVFINKIITQLPESEFDYHYGLDLFRNFNSDYSDNSSDYEPSNENSGESGTTYAVEKPSPQTNITNDDDFSAEDSEDENQLI